MFAILTLLAGAFALVYLMIHRTLPYDAREPPLAPQSIPLIGHIIGLSKSSFKYHVQLSERMNKPIFTMFLGPQKMYIITQADLIQKAQKQHKSLSFPHIEAQFVNTLCGSSSEAKAILDQGLVQLENDQGLFHDLHTGMREALAPGPGLNWMNRVMIREVLDSLNELPSDSKQKTPLSLGKWLRQTITRVTSRSVYGPQNPFEDKEVVDAFWVFVAKLMPILINVLPSITARVATTARDKVAKSLEKYYTAGGLETASQYANVRYSSCADVDVPLADIARYESSGSLATLMNTIPSVFWSLVLFNSDAQLFADLRQEIDGCTTTTEENGVTVKTIDIALLKKKGSLLSSAYQEVLRYRSMSVSTRKVTENTYLDGYLLKEGAILQMPAHVIHEDVAIWGDADFQPRRFLPVEGKKKVRETCFRTFGGGKTLCPGRHFATNEVLTFVSLLIARFDLKPVEGKWTIPTAFNTPVVTGIMEPDSDIDVMFVTRKGFEGVRWAAHLDDSTQTVAMVPEDQAS